MGRRWSSPIRKPSRIAGRFGRFLRRHACTLTLLPPAYAQLVDPDDLRVLKTLVTGGETARAETARSMSGCVRFVNAYGPTEASIQATSHVVESPAALGATVPIGRPIANVDALVLDVRGRVAPIGAPGELCVGGVAVGLGYLNRPELTAERFPPAPDARRRANLPHRRSRPMAG